MDFQLDNNKSKKKKEEKEEKEKKEKKEHLSIARAKSIV